MARALGLGVTPWGPLRSGMLSGKYTRDMREAESPGRQKSLERNFNEPAYSVIDVVERIAHEHEATAAQVALAWVRSRPGVASTIIGARTPGQLNDNLAALELALTAGDFESLDEVSRPKLNFPAELLPNALQKSYAGLTVDGEAFAKHELS